MPRVRPRLPVDGDPGEVLQVADRALGVRPVLPVGRDAVAALDEPGLQLPETDRGAVDVAGVQAVAVLARHGLDGAVGGAVVAEVAAGAEEGEVGSVDEGHEGILSGGDDRRVRGVDRVRGRARRDLAAVVERARVDERLDDVAGAVGARVRRPSVPVDVLGRREARVELREEPVGRLDHRVRGVLVAAEEEEDRGRLVVAVPAAVRAGLHAEAAELDRGAVLQHGGVVGEVGPALGEVGVAVAAEPRERLRDRLAADPLLRGAGPVEVRAPHLVVEDVDLLADASRVPVLPRVGVGEAVLGRGRLVLGRAVALLGGRCAGHLGDGGGADDAVRLETVRGLPGADLLDSAGADLPVDLSTDGALHRRVIQPAPRGVLVPADVDEMPVLAVLATLVPRPAPGRSLALEHVLDRAGVNVDREAAAMIRPARRCRVGATVTFAPRWTRPSCGRRSCTGHARRADSCAAAARPALRSGAARRTAGSCCRTSRPRARRDSRRTRQPHAVAVRAAPGSTRRWGGRPAASRPERVSAGPCRAPFPPVPGRVDRPVQALPVGWCVRGGPVPGREGLVVEEVELVLRPLLGPMRLDHVAHVHADAPVSRRAGMRKAPTSVRALGRGGVRRVEPQRR